MFSSIDTDKRKEVIDNCYWPLLQLASKGFKVSIEATALTLEIIQDIDSAWTSTLKQLLKEERIEFIGSGYAQIIAPIVPYEINIRNLEIGRQIYFEILEVFPEIYLINEMAFSADLISVYNKCGIRNVIIERNNFCKYSPSGVLDNDYKPIELHSKDGSGFLNVIWADTIVFQKFQRYVHKEISKKYYFEYLNSLEEQQICYLPLYTSDAEIFNFRPGRYKTENSLGNAEWKIIEDLYQTLNNKYDVLFLKELLGDIYRQKVVFNPTVPIQVKKQDKYNIYRWGLGGRDNLEINAQCYQILNYYRTRQDTGFLDWKELLFLWSSDFRTHITEGRFTQFKTKINKIIDRIDESVEELPKKAEDTDILSFNEDEDVFDVRTNTFSLILNKKKGFTINSFAQKKSFSEPLIGKIEQGAYDDISFASDFFSGHAVCYDLLGRQYTNLVSVCKFVEVLKDRVITSTESTYPGLKIHTQLTASASGIVIEREIEIGKPVLKIIHPFIFSFLPKTLSGNEIFFKVACGGEEMRQYSLTLCDNLDRRTNYIGVSALHGFSLTTGRMEIICGKKNICFEIDNSLSPLIASFHYIKNLGIGQDKLPYLRLIFSAQEVDDALQLTDERTNSIKSTLKIYYKDID